MFLPLLAVGTFRQRKRGGGDDDDAETGPPEVVALQPLAVIDHSCKGGERIAALFKMKCTSPIPSTPLHLKISFSKLLHSPPACTFGGKGEEDARRALATPRRLAPRLARHGVYATSPPSIRTYPPSAPLLPPYFCRQASSLRSCHFYPFASVGLSHVGTVACAPHCAHV